MKNAWKNKGFRVWTIVTAAVLVLALAVNIVASGPLFNTVSILLNSPRRMELLDGKENARFVSLPGADTRETAAQHGNEVTVAVCEEGFILLKNEGNALPLKTGAKISIFGKNSANMAAGGSGSGGSTGKDAKTAVLHDV